MTAISTRSAHPPEGRLPQLDGLRAFAFLAVFLHHSLKLPILWAGVDLFFVLSGFLITDILLRRRGTEGYFQTFYARRFWRIFPPYYLTLAISFLFFATEEREHWAWYALFLSNVRDAYFVSNAPGLGPMWSLAVEEQFYLLWPLLVYFIHPQHLGKYLVVLIGFAFCFRGFLTFASEGFHPVYNLLPSRIDLLASGAFLAVLRQRSRADFEKFARMGPWLVVLCAVLFGGLTALFPTFRTSAHSLLFNTVGYLLITVLMTGIVASLVPLREGFLYRIFTLRPLVYLGTISFMMYLCHGIVIDEIQHLGLSPIPSALISLAVIVAAASLSWHVFEGPLLKMKDRLFTYRKREMLYSDARVAV